MPSRAASHAARVFLRPMKSALFPGVSHAHGLGPGDISPSAALGGAEDASCPSAFVWSFVPSITAGAVCRRGRGAGSAAGRRPTAAASHALGGMPSRQPEEEERPQQPRFSRLPTPLPASLKPGRPPWDTSTCCKHLWVWRRWRFSWDWGREGAAGFRACFKTAVRALYGHETTVLQYWQTIPFSRKAALQYCRKVIPPVLQATPAAVQSCSSDRRLLQVFPSRDWMTLWPWWMQSQLTSAQLCKQNVATSVIRGEGAHARAEEGRWKDAADNDDAGRPLQLWACRFEEIGTPCASGQSVAGAAGLVCQGFAISKMCNEAFFYSFASASVAGD